MNTTKRMISETFNHEEDESKHIPPISSTHSQTENHILTKHTIKKLNFFDIDVIS